MAIAETAQHTPCSPHGVIDANELQYIAFCGHDEIAHGIFRSIPEIERPLYTNKYILSEVITGGIKKLRKFLASSAERSAAEEKEFIDGTVKLFAGSCVKGGSFPRELFQSLLTWSEELIRLSLLQEALHYYDETISLGVNKYPDLYIKSLIGKAAVLNTLGSFRDAQSILRSLSTRPYIIPDRNLVPEVLFDLGKESLLKGDVLFYKQLLFRGLRYFYTRVENRKLFVDQIARTYRRSIRVLFDAQVSPSDKVLFFIHRAYFVIARSRVLTLFGLTHAVKLLVLGYVYALNYGFRFSMRHSRATDGDRATAFRPYSRKRNVLVTRAMGGIGDLLMMTPGFHALKRKYPNEEIHLAIPKRYFPVFEGNPDVRLFDIENDHFEFPEYRRWFNFTDCPASRVETRTAPKVTKGRIEIFAQALKINRLAVRTMEKRPRYFVLPEERAFQINFWKANGLNGKKVVGIQLRSDEVYRDYPYMQQLVARVAQEYDVLLFDGEKIHGFEMDRVIRVDGLPMRRAFALASSCCAIIAPDSSFVHLAAAFDLPCVALFGPIDGRVRTKHYPKCIYLDARKKLGCMPCWRNDQIVCTLTNMRSSVCMTDITVNEITQSLTHVLQENT